MKHTPLERGVLPGGGPVGETPVFLLVLGAFYWAICQGFTTPCFLGYYELLVVAALFVALLSFGRKVPPAREMCEALALDRGVGYRYYAHWSEKLAGHPVC